MRGEDGQVVTGGTQLQGEGAAGQSPAADACSAHSEISRQDSLGGIGLRGGDRDMAGSEFRDVRVGDNRSYKAL